MEQIKENPERPTTSYILRGGKKTLNIDDNPFKEEEKINKEEEYDNYDVDWKNVKKKFLKEIPGWRHTSYDRCADSGREC